jgi:hypothetical protein
MNDNREPQPHAVPNRTQLTRQQRDRQRQIRSLVLMILGTAVLAATAIWLGQQ